MLDYAFSFLKKNIFLIESSFINRSYIFTTMGGSKNISPAQKEKKQQRGSDTKKGKKDSKGDKNEKAEISVILNEANAEKIIKNAKIITLYDFARQTGVKISTANEFLQKSLKNGAIKKIGGFSGHHVYQPVSE